MQKENGLPPFYGVVHLEYIYSGCCVFYLSLFLNSSHFELLFFLFVLLPSLS